ncbi:protein FLX-like 2 [Chenopodium quinoa]|uniref:protein FLX-like 2 n=1 Tax=Chenopodium quinoa TaxID=63459 RepID=UPI000B777E20|nr:protein FLX-like 2 [Chenopodium quinoa]
MGSKGRLPPHHMRHPLHGPGLVHPEPFGAGIRPPHGGFPHGDMLPPPEILEQKLASQHVEMERLATENQRLAATHGSSRQQLAAAQQELQMLEAQIRDSKLEREQQMRGLIDKISKMEAELKSVDRLKLDLQQARTEAQSLVEVRQELMSKVQQLNIELQRAHVDVQQIPSMMSELNHLRQEFHQYRATYEHEKKVYRDHIESLHAMEKEYRSMNDEVAKLRAELNNISNSDKRSAYVSAAGYGDIDASAHNPSGQSSYEDGYGTQQVHHQFPASGAAATASTPTPAVTGGSVVASGGGTPTYAAPQSGPASARAGYDVSRAPGYEAQRLPIPTYDLQGGQAYNAQRASGYDAYRGANYDMQRPPYDPQRAAAYEMPWANNCDAHSRGAVAPLPPQSQTPVNNMPYGSAAPPPVARTAAGNEMQPRGGNTARR